MRKWVAFISLTVFLALQYGKLVSYWQCKVNAAITQAICDCEKLLIDVHKDSSSHANPVAIAKEKTEESYFFHGQDFNHRLIFEIPGNTTSRKTLLIPEGFSASIFQPPRI